MTECDRDEVAERWIRTTSQDDRDAAAVKWLLTLSRDYRRLTLEINERNLLPDEPAAHSVAPGVLRALEKRLRLEDEARTLRLRADEAEKERDGEREEVGRLKRLIERDRTGLGAGLAKIQHIVLGYRWIPDGEWGDYHCDDRSEEALRAEIGCCLMAINAAAVEALEASGGRVKEAFNPGEEIDRWRASFAETAEAHMRDGLMALWPDRKDSPTLTALVADVIELVLRLRRRCDETREALVQEAAAAGVEVLDWMTNQQIVNAIGMVVSMYADKACVLDASIRDLSARVKAAEEGASAAEARLRWAIDAALVATGGDEAATKRAQTVDEDSDTPVIREKVDGKAVLFLDIDGTLGDDGQQVPMEKFVAWNETAAALNELLYVCDAHIVLCSGRIGKEDLHDKFSWMHEPWRLSGRCRSPFTRRGMTAKEAMIVDWLERAAERGVRPRSFAVFDDEVTKAPHWSIADRCVKAEGPLTKESKAWRNLWILLGGRYMAVHRLERQELRTGE